MSHVNTERINLSISSRCSLIQLQVRADPISAFGGIVAFNRPVDEALAKEIREFR
jgi:AICAR transformylase/IMP cyclohydrolase PurH